MKNTIVSGTQVSTVVEPTLRRPALPAANQQRRVTHGVAIIGSVGVLLVALGFVAARYDLWWADILFWAGLLALYVPTTLRLLAPDVPRTERISLVVFLGVGLYLVKLLHSPQQFTFYDELLHWRSVADIQQTGHLFGRNPLLPISSVYPGLHSITVALANVAGLSIFQAGICIILMARLIMCLGLFLLYERVSRSSAVAGLATLLYCANPAFLFFDAQFGYESLALMFVPLALVAQHHLLHNALGARTGWYIVLWMSICATIVTHHLSTYFLLVVFFVWAAFPAFALGGVAFLQMYGGVISGNQFWKVIGGQYTDLRSQLFDRTVNMRVPSPARVFVLALGATLLWTIFVARTVLDYLGSYGWTSLLEVFRIVIGESEARRLFQGFAGDVAPAWEQSAGYAAVLLVMLLLPFGLHRIWQQYRHERLALTLGILTLAYPLSQVIRFTDLGLQIAGRTVEFLFMPIAFVVAVWLAQPTMPRIRLVLMRRLAGVAIVTMFVGGVILGWPRWARLPRPYRVSAETRSIEAKSLAVAAWAQTQLPPNQRFAADRINGLLLGAYGDQYLVSLAYDKVNVPQLFFVPQLDSLELQAIDRGQIQYVVIDHRLSTSVPASGIYFEIGEPGTSRHIAPIPASALEKFASLSFMSRVYDNGTIEIYTVDRERLP